MKLIHESGPNKGREVELRPPFISLGRETDNDVIIDEHEVSRYHAKIEMDGSIWVIRDLESSNGVRLNGQKIDESAPLEHKDEVRIGGMTFTITDPSQAAAEPAVTEAAPALATSDKPVEPVVTGTPKNEAAQKRVKLMVTALATMIIVFVALFLLNAPTKKQPPVDHKVLRKARYEKAKLHLEYKHEKSGFDEDLNDYNLSMYSVTVKDHRITAQVEKLLEGVSFNKSAELSVEEERELRDALLALDYVEFVDARSLPPKERMNGYERISVIARAANRGNAVEFINEEGNLPPAVTKAIFDIKQMVERKLGIPVRTLKEAFELARELFTVAKGLSEERNADPKNLWNAVANANKALVVLQGYKQTPPFYRDLQNLHDECKKDHKEAIDQLLKDADLAEKTNLSEARRIYQVIISRIGDPRDMIFLNAREKIYKIDKELSRGGAK